MKTAFFSITSFLIIILFLSSCDKRMVYDDFQRIENGSWHWDEPIDFTVNMLDTVSICNILIQLRHSTDYPLSNLYMFVHVKGPSGQTMTDTINFKLAENSGKWIGKGIGNIRELAYLFKRNTKFAEPGMYHFSIEQAMRLPDIPVSEVGIRIEKINP